MGPELTLPTLGGQVSGITTPPFPMKNYNFIANITDQNMSIQNLQTYYSVDISTYAQDFFIMARANSVETLPTVNPSDIGGAVVGEYTTTIGENFQIVYKQDFSQEYWFITPDGVNFLQDFMIKPGEAFLFLDQGTSNGQFNFS